MSSKIYKSSIFDRALFSVTAAGILIPGVWVVLYGIDKRSYNWPLAAAGILLCAYTVYLLQKFFTYKAVINDDSIEIHSFKGSIAIRFDDIIEICERRNACYIIDKVMQDGKYYIRGTVPPVEYSGGMDKVKINLAKLPVVQRAFFDNYEEMSETLMNKCGVQPKSQKVRKDGKSFFVSTAMLDSIKYWQLRGADILKMLLPYLVILLTFLMGLVEYGAMSKGNVSSWLTVYIKYVFPILVVIGLYILVLNFVHYFRKLLSVEPGRPSVPKGGIIMFVLFNTILSIGVILLFFIILNRVSI